MTNPVAELVAQVAARRNSKKRWPQITHKEFIENEIKIAGKHKLDSLGRRNNGFVHISDSQRVKNLHRSAEQSRINGRQRVKTYHSQHNVRFDSETSEALKAKAAKEKKTVSTKIREYVEWGLENEE